MEQLTRNITGRWFLVTRWEADALGRPYPAEALDVHTSITTLLDSQREQIAACGVSPEDAVRELMMDLHVWDAASETSVHSVPATPPHTWARTVRGSNGKTYECSGWQIPGGYVIGAWKRLD